LPKGGTEIVLPFTDVSFPRALAVDAAGDVFLADGPVYELPKGRSQITLPFKGLGSAVGVAVDAAGDVFAVDGGNEQVLELLKDGTQKTLPFTGLDFPGDIAVDGSGNVFVANEAGNGQVLEVPKGGTSQITLPLSGVSLPLGVAVDATGDLFVDGSQTPPLELLTDGSQITLPFTGLKFPGDIAVDGAGDVYVTDVGNTSGIGFDIGRVVELSASGAVKTATTTTLTSSANPGVFGQSVTYTATVSPGSGSGIPTGTVTFLDGATSIGTGTLVNGAATLTLSVLAVGSNPITATYSGDTNFLTSTSVQLNQVISKAPTAISLVASSAGSIGFGHSVTFTVALAVPSPGGGVPTGTIRFSVDGTRVAQTPLTTMTASVTTAALSPGHHVIGASYSGDGDFLSSRTTLAYAVTCSEVVTGNQPGTVIASGDSTCVVGATIGGGLIALRGTSLALIDSTVKGSVVSLGSAVSVCGSAVGDAVVVFDAQGLVIVGDPGDAECAGNAVGGTLLLLGNTNGVEAIGNIAGEVVAYDNGGSGPYPGDLSSVTGNSVRQ